jgi:ubiquinone/menaquinone biosynthesis C-methylase UbiE
MQDHKIRKLMKMTLDRRQRFHFDHERAKNYESAYDYRAKTFNWMVKIIASHIATKKSALDIGAGTGDLIRAIKIKGRFVGLDISDAMLNVARKKCKRGIFVQGSAYSLPFANEAFEAVIYKYALHHLDEPLVSLQEAYRVLKPSGDLIIADVSSFDGNYKNHLIFKKLNRLREPANYEYRTIGVISDLLRQAGFKKFRIVMKKFNLILEDWLNCFYESKKTIKLVLYAPASFKRAIHLRTLPNHNHRITLISFVLKASK